MGNLSVVVKQLGKERTRLADELHRVTAALTAFGKVYMGGKRPKAAVATPRKKRTISAAGRMKIAAELLGLALAILAPFQTQRAEEKGSKSAAKMGADFASSIQRTQAAQDQLAQRIEDQNADLRVIFEAADGGRKAAPRNFARGISEHLETSDSISTPPQGPQKP
jgi:hypothetical protein